MLIPFLVSILSLIGSTVQSVDISSSTWHLYDPSQVLVLQGEASKGVRISFNDGNMEFLGQVTWRNPKMPGNGMYMQFVTNKGARKWVGIGDNSFASGPSVMKIVHTDSKMELYNTDDTGDMFQSADITYKGSMLRMDSAAYVKIERFDGVICLRQSMADSCQSFTSPSSSQTTSRPPTTSYPGSTSHPTTSQTTTPPTTSDAGTTTYPTTSQTTTPPTTSDDGTTTPSSTYKPPSSPSTDHHHDHESSSSSYRGRESSTEGGDQKLTFPTESSTTSYERRTSSEQSSTSESHDHGDSSSTVSTSTSQYGGKPESSPSTSPYEEYYDTTSESTSSSYQDNYRETSSSPYDDKYDTTTDSTSSSPYDDKYDTTTDSTSSSPYDDKYDTTTDSTTSSPYDDKYDKTSDSTYSSPYDDKYDATSDSTSSSPYDDKYDTTSSTPYKKVEETSSSTSPDNTRESSSTSYYEEKRSDSTTSRYTDSTSETSSSRSRTSSESTKYREYEESTSSTPTSEYYKRTSTSTSAQRRDRSTTSESSSTSAFGQVTSKMTTGTTRTMSGSMYTDDPTEETTDCCAIRTDCSAPGTGLFYSYDGTIGMCSDYREMEFMLNDGSISEDMDEMMSRVEDQEENVANLRIELTAVESDNMALRQRVIELESTMDTMKMQYDKFASTITRTMEAIQKLVNDKDDTQERVVMCDGVEADGSCFVMQEEMTHMEASESCESIGGHLATWSLDQSVSVHQALLTAAQNTGYSGSMWIGASFDQNKRETVWVDGSDFDIKALRSNAVTKCIATYKKVTAGFKCANRFPSWCELDVDMM